MGCLLFFTNLWALRSWIIIIVAFVSPCYLLVCDTMESKCLYAIIVMAVLWLTEVIPISVTSLFPVFLFPMLGLVKGKNVCSVYVNDTTILFLGGLIIAVAIEETGLHKRMAVGIMKIVGASPNMLLLGLMTPTWFLSMWISNTATTSMMLPIITALVDQLKNSELENKDNNAEDGHLNGSYIEENSVKDDMLNVKIEFQLTEKHLEDELERQRKLKRRTKELQQLGKVFALGVAYASNAGGIATLVGTPPNLVLQGIANTKFSAFGKGVDSGITFANWMGLAVPLSIIILFISWIWLQLMFIRCGCCYKENRQRANAVRKVINRELKQLGTITFAEVMVLILFVCVALLWIFRELPDIRGWSVLFKNGYVTDSTASILIACLLFMMPAEIPKIFCFNKGSDNANPRYRPILTWDVTVRKIPWGVLILLGGGFALADASQVSGLSKWLSCELQSIKMYDPWIINLIVTCVVAAATEVTSNTATATLLLPIMFDLAVGLQMHPLYMMISVTIACSFAFMLPVATPPNAIVFSTGYLKIYDMALAGIMMNVIGIAALTLAMNTWAIPLFNLGTMPEIFKNLNTTHTNCTMLCPAK